MKLINIYVFTLFWIISSCTSTQTTLGDKKIQLFDNELINFTDTKHTNTKILHLASGRVLLKKVVFPSYEKEVKATLKVQLQSAGDRWDKSGSFFVLPKNSPINFKTIAEGSRAFPEIENFNYKGIVAGENYLPVVELMRFMTPFGVGFYSEKNKRKPVYIPFYEKQVLWEQDVTDRLSLLEGETWIGVWIDTWTAEGYRISATLDFEETKAIDFPKKKTQVLPLVNTVAYGFGQELPDFFSRQDLKLNFELPKSAKNVALNYITTGHGGHSGGDEFTKQKNTISIDGKEVFSFVPWRDDCASFRRFNPSSGVWLQKDTASYLDFKKGKYLEKVIEERIASSDLSRSNWCPGSDVPAVVINLGDISEGKHELSISIPNAQPADGDKLNHWLVSAYLMWEE